MRSCHGAKVASFVDGTVETAMEQLLYDTNFGELLSNLFLPIILEKNENGTVSPFSHNLFSQILCSLVPSVLRCYT